MSKNEFDELLLKKISEDDFEYNPASWDKFSKLLPPALPVKAGNNTASMIKGIAAGIALLLIAGTLFITLKPAETTNETITAKNKKTETNTNFKPGSTPNLAQTAVTSGRVEKEQLPAESSSTANSFQPAFHEKETVLPNSSGRQIAGTNIASGTVEQNPGQLPEQIAANEQSPQPDLAALPKKTLKEADYYNPWAVSEPASGRNTKEKTVIALGGGVNYGNLNTGYTVGFSARRKIGNDFFVDGTVAMMYNNNATNISNYSGPTDLGNFKARPSAEAASATLPTPAIEPTQNLYYLQFNPSVGYQIEKKVAVSIGGDLQQMLNQAASGEKVQQEQNMAKIFPATDIGITAKSEFSVTPSIQAGLLYREGLNNLFKGSGPQYVNRRYVQVQFKYNIPLR